MDWIKFVPPSAGVYILTFYDLTVDLAGEGWVQQGLLPPIKTDIFWVNQPGGTALAQILADGSNSFYFKVYAKTSGQTGAYKVTIGGKTLTSVSVSGPSSVNAGSCANYTATAYFSDGTSQVVTSSASWSENSSYAYINSPGQLCVSSSLPSTQNVTVTATYTSTGQPIKSGTKTVSMVKPKTPTSVSVSGPSSVNAGSCAKYTATAYFSDGTSQVVTSSASWSDNSSEAYINSPGELCVFLSLPSTQNVTVTATYTYNGVTKSGTKTVSMVKPKTPTSVLVSGPSSVKRGTCANYTATAFFSDGTSQNVTSSAKWSENSSYATISSTGQLCVSSSLPSTQNVTVTASYTYSGLRLHATNLQRFSLTRRASITISTNVYQIFVYSLI